MAKRYNIATCQKSGDFTLLGKWNFVDEQLFWQLVEDKVKELGTSAETNNNGLELIKDYINQQKGPVNVINLSFEITGKD